MRVRHLSKHTECNTKREVSGKWTLGGLSCISVGSLIVANVPPGVQEFDSEGGCLDVGVGDI